MDEARHEQRQKEHAKRPLPWHVEQSFYRKEKPSDPDYPRVSVHAANGAWVLEMNLSSASNPHDLAAAVRRAEAIVKIANETQNPDLIG